MQKHMFMRMQFIFAFIMWSSNLCRREELFLFVVVCLGFWVFFCCRSRWVFFHLLCKDGVVCGCCQYWYSGQKELVWSCLKTQQKTLSGMYLFLLSVCLIVCSILLERYLLLRICKKRSDHKDNYELRLITALWNICQWNNPKEV